MRARIRIALVLLLLSPLIFVLPSPAKADQVVSYQLSGVQFDTGDISQSSGKQTATGSFTVDLTTSTITLANIVTTADPSANRYRNPAGFPATTFTASGSIAFLGYDPEFEFTAPGPNSNTGTINLSVNFSGYINSSTGSASLYFVQEIVGNNIFTSLLRTAHIGSVSTGGGSGQSSLTITTKTLPDAVSGKSYNNQLAATGGQGAITWTLSPGLVLPAGFSLSKAGVLSTDGTPLPSTPADESNLYLFTVDATDSTGETAQKQLSLTIDPLTCDAVLPAVDVSFSTGVSYHSDPLTLTFTEPNPSDDLSSFESISNTGLLQGSLIINGKPLSFTSSTVATLHIFQPGAISPLQNRVSSGGILIKNSLLNGPFSSSDYYLEWTSPGFQVTDNFTGGYLSELFPFVPPIVSGPLTFWVDLNNLGVSPAKTPLPAVIQGAESYLHTELSQYFVLPAMIGAVTIPSNDVYTASDTAQYIRSSNTTRETIALVNRSNRTFEGPIQLVFDTSLSPEHFYLFTPDPPYTSTLGVSGIGLLVPAPYLTANVGTFSPAMTVYFTFQYLGPPQKLPYTPYFYAGTFLH